MLRSFVVLIFLKREKHGHPFRPSIEKKFDLKTQAIQGKEGRFHGFAQKLNFAKSTRKNYVVSIHYTEFLFAFNLFVWFSVCGGGVIPNIIGMNNPYNLSGCIDYVKTHTYMCSIVYDNLVGFSAIMGFTDGLYEGFVKSLALLAVLNFSNVHSNFYEGSTNMLAITSLTTSNLSYLYPVYPIGHCLCTTNNCNINFSVCTSGLNYSSLLLSNTNTTFVSTTPTISMNVITNGSILQQSNTTISTTLSSMINGTNFNNTNANTASSTSR